MNAKDFGNATFIEQPDDDAETPPAIISSTEPSDDENADRNRKHAKKNEN